MLVEITEFHNLLNSKTTPPYPRLVGLDVGSKTIGLALSDLSWNIATPLKTLHRKSMTQDIKLLIAAIEEYDAQALVVGLPINLDGTEGPQCQFVRNFVQALLEKHDIPICFWDERLSTQAVTRILLAADMTRSKRKKVVDKLAASYILQGALERLQSLRNKT